MPTCPKCLHNFHRGAESLCPHCGFSLENLDKKYGRDSIPYRRVCDNAGALRQQDRVKLNALLEKLERRIPLRESMLLHAAGSIMKDAVHLVARKARSKVRHPMRYGLTPPPPPERKGGGAA